MLYPKIYINLVVIKYRYPFISFGKYKTVLRFVCFSFLFVFLYLSILKVNIYIYIIYSINII